MICELPNQCLIECVILSRVSASPDKEVCGFLLTDGYNLSEVYHGIGREHSAVMPVKIPIDIESTSSCITELSRRGVAVQKMLPCISGMPFMICYHSHPGGDIMPSNEDIKKAFFSEYLLGMALLNFGCGLQKLRCYDVVCTPDGRFNWWRMKKII